MMKKAASIIYNNLLAMLSKRKILCSILIFIFIDLVTYKTGNNYNLNKLIKQVFYGTNSLMDMTIELFKWTFYQLFLLYIVLNFISNEIKTRNIYTILRIGSKKLWINCIIISILIFCILYFLMGIMSVAVLNYKLLIYPIDYKQIINIELLLSLSSFIVCLIGLIFTIMIKNESIIIVMLVTLYYSSIAIGKQFPSIDKWLIFNQGILAKHYYSNFSFKWSYNFICIFACVLYIFIRKLVYTIDLSRIYNN